MTAITSKIILAVFLGGGIGSALRYSISAILSNVKTEFTPLGTLTANVLSCFVMALTLAVFHEKLGESDWMKAFILIGFCGGLSTFSTFSFETFSLLKSGHLGMAFLNILLSILMCLTIFYFFAKRA